MRPRRPRRLRVLLTALGAGLVIAAGSSVGLSAGVFQSYQDIASDALVATTDTDPRIVVVGIDEPAQTAVGAPWPWPRDVQARLVQRIARAGADVVLYDVALTTPTQADGVLAHEAAATRVTYAVPVQLQRSGSERFLQARAESRPAPDFDSGCTGHAAITQDPGDGVVRSLPLIVERADHRLLPALSLATLLCRAGVAQPVVRPGGLQYDGTYIPTQKLQRLRLRYSEALTDRSSRQYYSAARVLTADVDLHGKVVLVGVTDPTLGDVHLVPGHKTAGVAGVFIHANALNTILRRSYIREVPHRQGWVAVTVLALALSLLAVLLRPWAVLLAAIGTAAAYVAFALYEASRGSLVQLVWPGVAATAALATALALRYLLEERQRLRVAGLFAQYVPAAVVDQLLATDRVPAAVAGERLDVAVLFCDLRGFTALAAELEPAKVRVLLDAYYRHATELVHAHRGTLMQYVGDEVFAVFGAPLPLDDPAGAAYRCALALQSDQAELARELADLGVPAVSYGIGLHFGDVVAAHVGSDERRQYAVVGTTVNVGARLCSFAQAGEVALSDAVRIRLSEDCTADDVGLHAFKGVEAVRVWRVPATTSGTTPASTY